MGNYKEILKVEKNSSRIILERFDTFTFLRFNFIRHYISLIERNCFKYLGFK